MIEDHSSRIETPIEDKKGAEIKENFPNYQLFHVKTQLP